jgi:hypothetical protein
MKYPKKIINSLYIVILMIIVVSLLLIQSVKDFIFSILKIKDKKAISNKNKDRSTHRYIIKQNNP